LDRGASSRAGCLETGADDFSLCAACHAIVERLQAVRVWLPPQLLILWREQHPEAEYQLPLPFEPEQASGALVRFNPKVVELDL